MLERVHGRVLDRRLVEEGHVPEVEVGGPDRQRHERVREHAQALDRAEREQRPQDRAVQPGEQRERREVAEDDVLEHVEAEELLLADRRHGRGEREQEQQRSRARRGRSARAASACRGGAASARASRRRTPRARPARAAADRASSSVSRSSTPTLDSARRETLPLPPRHSAGAPGGGALHRQARVRARRAARPDRRGVPVVRARDLVGGAGRDRLQAPPDRARARRRQRRRPARPVGAAARRPPRAGPRRRRVRARSSSGQSSRSCAIQAHGGRRTFIATNAGYRLEVHPPRDWLDELLEASRGAAADRAAAARRGSRGEGGGARRAARRRA